ncbi:MAG TPA: cytochrome P450 [Acetobacteraceae bacterium]|nr:cytochrome P450 [Acetobacteraceae bacterium]
MDIMPEVAAYWDPYDRAVCADPYPAFRRLREEQPLYYNDKYDFYALSRYDDMMGAFADNKTFSSARGDIMEQIKANIPVPSGVFIHEDPPIHTMHRSVVTRVFTPKKMAALEPRIRAFCADVLDPLIGTGEFDFVQDLGMEMPMRVIGMLLGIPEQDLQAVRERADASLRTEPGKPMTYENHDFRGSGFEDYVDWRMKHPSDDLMTELLTVEFEDQTGTMRRLTRDEVLIYTNILAGAGNETTNRLIGWTGKVLGDHPEQRRQIVENRGLIPQAIEEILRFEPPGPQVARYVTRDTEYYGTKVPEGSVMMLLPASGNRDDRKFINGDSFDINRPRVPHITFGHGFHVCLGNALARVEGRVALDEVLNRFPDWEVDIENAELSSTSTVRGWETLPTFTNGAKPTPGRAPRRQARTAPVPAAQHVPGAQKWKIILTTPVGPQEMTAHLAVHDGALTGAIESEMGSQDIKGTANGNRLSWTMDVTKPMPIKLDFEIAVDGDQMSGNAKLGMFGNAPLIGQRVS